MEDARFNPELPLAEASTLPSRFYRDPEIYQRELREIFGKSWNYVGRQEQVAEPGQYFTTEVGEESVVVARDKQGEIRAFSNICRHRATQIVKSSCGKASFLQCRYHGWTYDLGGQLKGAPEFEGVKNFDKSQVQLPQFRLETFGPFLFVNLNRDAKPLLESLRQVSRELGNTDWTQLKFVRRVSYDLACNWKVFVDNYLDGGYHVNTLHPSLASVINYKEYRTEADGETAIQFSPLQTGKNAEVAQVRKGEMAYYVWAYPGFMLNLYDGVMDTNLVVPLGPEKCRVHFDYYFSETEGEAAQRYIENSIAVAHQVQLEDQEICESVQRGLASQNFSSGRFSVTREVAAYHFHRLVDRALR